MLPIVQFNLENQTSPSLTMNNGAVRRLVGTIQDFLHVLSQFQALTNLANMNH